MASKSRTVTRASVRTNTLTPTPPVTRNTRAKAAVVPPSLPPSMVAAKRIIARKPLANGDNGAEVITPEHTAVAIQQRPPGHKKAESKSVNVPVDKDREPIMAYLRIRPYLGEDKPTSIPYLTHLSDTSVRMTDPHHDTQFNYARFRPSTVPHSSVYTFSHVFPPPTTQSDFFTKTTLPLVRDVLLGQNALLFTYGVTNSGKTYTVQGGNREGSAGIVPRTLDVLFNSIEGLQGDGQYRPVRLEGIERFDTNDTPSPHLSLTEPTLREVLSEHLGPTASDTDSDPTVLKVDRNYRYCIWLSYAEVYNEKVYDLLASVKDDSENTNNTNNPRLAHSNGIHPLRITRKALQLKPCPQSDSDPSASFRSGKYIAGLRQFRVQSASQAKALIKLGQLHRRVFGTLANRESSRSHGLVIIKVVRGHRGERDEAASFQVSRLTLVDLAGSERTKQAQTTGDRLKEAGNINKSLMVLGQCMEVMRANQRRTAVNSIVEVGKIGKIETRDAKKGYALVPFRHSKLTEALMDYFVGDGRVVMIVNVNPYDTGYDENSHVMKFAALAREVYVMPAPAPMHHLPPPLGPDIVKTRAIPSVPVVIPAQYRRRVTISVGGGGRKASETIVEVLEEDEAEEDHHSDGGDDEPINPLVDALFDELEELRMRLFESEMRCAIMEAETREEVMKEMEGRMRSMEKMYARRLMHEVEQNEIKTDAKIDLLHQSGMFGNSPKKRNFVTNGEIPEIDANMTEDGENGTDCSLSGEEFTFESDDDLASDLSTSQSPSPLAAKNTGKGNSKMPFTTTSTGHRETRQFVPDGPEALMLPSDEEEMSDETETDDGEGDRESLAETGTSDTNEEEEDDSEDEWIPPPERTPRAVKAKGRHPQQTTCSSPSKLVDNQTTAKRPTRSQMSKLARDMDDLSLISDDSILLLPAKKPRASKQSTAGGENLKGGDAPVKKKRQLTKVVESQR